MQVSLYLDLDSPKVNKDFGDNDKPQLRFILHFIIIMLRFLALRTVWDKVSLGLDLDFPKDNKDFGNNDKAQLRFILHFIFIMLRLLALCTVKDIIILTRPLVSLVSCWKMFLLQQAHCLSHLILACPL